MRSLVAVLAFAAAPILQAADECTFDQDHQTRVIAAVAKMTAGAIVDSDRRQVTWTEPGGETTTFGYGGCADLGSVVMRSTPMAGPRTRAQVFELARELAGRFWSNEHVASRPAAEALLQGLSEGQFTVEAGEGVTAFHVPDPGYVQLYVEHAYADGVDRVTIAWQGNF